MILRMVRGYQGEFAGLNSPQIAVDCRRVDLLRCAVTVGAPIGFSWASIRQYGLPNVLYAAIAENAFAILQNIDPRYHGLRRSAIFETHLSSKKSSVSELVGLAVAKFNAEQLLDIVDLIHVETLKKQGAITFLPGSKMEPDLAGKDSLGRWHIFEAKGRSTRSALDPALRRAKNQTASVDLIEGAVPTTRSASATFLGTNEIYSVLEDPTDGSGRSITINEDRFVQAYYAPYFITLRAFPELTRSERFIDGVSLNTIEIPIQRPDSDYGSFTLGLASDVVRAYESMQ